MADLTPYILSMTGEEADGGIRVGMDIGALNGIPYSNGDNEISTAVPGVDYGYPLLQGYGPPTANTAASFGQHYYDLSATAPPFEWICIAFTETDGFVWRQHNDAGYFQATYGATSYQEIIKNYNLGKVCIVVDNNNDIFYLGQVETNLLTFYRAFRYVSSAQDGARFEFENLRVTSTNTWSRFFYYGENAANRTTVVNAQSTDTQYPTAKAVYTYGQSIDAAAQGYAEAAEDAAKGYTDEQLEPVADAAGKAEEYALGAYVTPTASGAIASFDDGAEDIPVKALTVAVEPVQDLNGYDAPWPPGGGKNLADFVDGYTVDANGQVLSSSGRASTVTPINIVGGQTYVFACHGDASTRGIYLVMNGNTAVRRIIGIMSGTTLDTSGGDKLFVTIYSDTVDVTIEGSKPMVVLAEYADILYAPYSNICPISGWTGAKVQRTGKNFLDNTASFSLSVGANIEPTATGVKVTARYDGGPYYGYIKVCPLRTVMGKPLYIRAVESSSTSNLNSLSVYYGNTDGTGLVREWGIPISGNIAERTITIPYNEQNENLWLYIAVNASNAGEPAGTWREYNEFVVSLDGYAYEPYQGETYSINFPTEAGTVYGGSLDVTSGVLTVDRVEVDLGTLSYRHNAVYGMWTPALESVIKSISSTVVPNMICSQYKAAAWNSVFGGGTTSGLIGVTDIGLVGMSTTETDPTVFKASMSGVQLVYELASPLVYQITPTEVKTLLGMNNIWTDTGDTEVTYRADPTIIYNKLTAAIISSGGTV